MEEPAHDGPTRSAPVGAEQVALWHAEFAEKRRKRAPTEADLRAAVWEHYESEVEADRKHLFGRTCAENGITHKLTKPYHPWTNGQAERMNRTIKDATLKVFYYLDIESLKAHVLAFVKTYNFAKHLKALRWKTPLETVAQAWTKDPSIFKINPRYLIPGPNSLVSHEIATLMRWRGSALFDAARS